jgi:hypothetical protein
VIAKTVSKVANAFTEEQRQLADAAAARLQRLGLSDAQIAALPGKSLTNIHTDILAPMSGTFGGILTSGEHEPDGSACALEAAHVAIGDEWSDEPNLWPDLRPLNDGPWDSDEQRTAHVVPVLIALWDWQDWSPERQRRWAETVVLRTVRELIAELPGLPTAVAQACRDSGTLEAAEAAAWAAAKAEEAAAWAAANAEEAAAAAANAANTAKASAWAAANAAARAAAKAAAARAANAVPVLVLACRIWRDAAEDTRR